MAPRVHPSAPHAFLPRRLGAWAGWAWAGSLVVHLAVAVLVGRWALGSMAAPGVLTPGVAAERLVTVDLPAMAETSVSAEDTKNPVGAVPVLSGGPTIARVDTGRDGRGGEVNVDRAATHLADLDERLQLTQGTMNRLDRDQTARLRSQATRASWEDRRSTTHPMDLAFLSAGELARLERRTVAKEDPSRGVLQSRPGSLPGAPRGVSDVSGSELAGEVGTTHDGAVDSAPGAGVRDGIAGRMHRSAAAVAHARPDVKEAPTSVEALVRGRPRDNLDSEQELTSKVAALVHASTAGGIVAKTGTGGTEGGGEAGAFGVSGAGSRSTPLGDGMSDWFDLSSTDPRIVAYFRRFHAKVDPLWANAFPKSAMLELKQGTVILDVSIAADGTAKVDWPPERASGIPEFDKNCADAVRRASPFDPIPPELGLTRLHVRAPFVAKNPIVN